MPKRPTIGSEFAIDEDSVIVDDGTIRRPGGAEAVEVYVQTGKGKSEKKWFTDEVRAAQIRAGISQDRVAQVLAAALEATKVVSIRTGPRTFEQIPVPDWNARLRAVAIIHEPFLRAMAKAEQEQVEEVYLGVIDPARLLTMSQDEVRDELRKRREHRNG